VAEQRYQAVLAVIADGLTVSQVASKVGVSRQTLHAWLARYEAEGLEGLADRSHRPRWCPHQMPAVVEVAVLELRRSRPYWGPRRLVYELAKRGVSPVPSESGCIGRWCGSGCSTRSGGVAGIGSGSGGSGLGRWSCGRWTSWAGLRWPMGPAPRR